MIVIEFLSWLVGWFESDIGLTLIATCLMNVRQVEPYPCTYTCCNAGPDAGQLERELRFVISSVVLSAI